MSKHYHVFAGTVGCLQDGEATFKTKADAQQFMVDEAADYREAGFTVSGSAQSGYYAIDPINYMELVPCNDPACELLEA